VIILRVVSVLVLAGLVQHGGASGQPLRVGDAAAVPANRSLSYAAYPLTALNSLDAQIQRAGSRFRLILARDTVEFEPGSPFYTHRGKLLQLPFPVEQRGDDLLVPRGFFTDQLPRALAPNLVWADNRLARVPAAASTQAASQPRPPATPPKPETATTKAVTPPSSAPKDTARPTPRPAPPATAQKAAPPASTASKDASKPANRNLNRIVVIDPGHGGKDPGKPGPNGLLEKNVALAVSNRLAGYLRERGYEVHLTRTRDTLIALGDRPHMANEWKKGRPSTLFVSIHANSAVRSARGFETFFLSDAQTDDERRVAEMENEVVKFEERPKEAAPELDLILSGLRNDYYLRASNDLAATIQQHIAKVHPGPNRGVKRAGFRVLVGALMPAVLVELAFISNPDEAKLLGTSAFQQKIAFSLADAIANYFDSYEHLWMQD